MHQLTKALEGPDQARHGVGPTTGGAVDRDRGVGRGAAQLSEQPALEPEVDAQPLTGWIKSIAAISPRNA
jgi:hypothetical protein